jgi:hypothetical protein
MSHAKQAAKRKRPSKAVPVLGAAGLLSLAGSASAATAIPAADMPGAQNTTADHQITLGEEQLSDVSLGTFYVFDKENLLQEPSIKLARGGGGGHGCGGHGGGGHGCGGRGCGGRGCGGHGCGGHGCGRGCGGRGCGAGGCGCWGGCGCGCCLSWGGCGLC